ncbi:MAG: sugar ABC transporter permease [Chloroflexi bacterium]|nr:sugar ABC transporter permease [Chloroflexota bacterium]
MSTKLHELSRSHAQRRALKRMGGRERRDALWGLFFITPWIMGFLAFYLMPMVSSLGFSLFDFTLSAPEDARFIGLDNWQRMLFDDPNTWHSMKVSLGFLAISLPTMLIFGLLLAILLNAKHLVGRNLFRTLFYAPTMVPLIAAILIWESVLNPSTGWVNRLISLSGFEATGINGLRWLDDPSLVYFAYTFISLWGIGNAILINLAGLQNIPTELYEAAAIDGAGWIRQLRKITLPMMSPIIFYNLVLGLVLQLQYFIVPWVLTEGTGYPQGSTSFFMVYFYKQAFTFQNMGYGATLAWLMFVVTLIITLVLFASARFWVFYGGGRED